MKKQMLQVPGGFRPIREFFNEVSYQFQVMLYLLKKFLMLPALIGLLLFSFDSFAQSTPCACAQRWENGANWNANGSITDFPASNHAAVRGVISCHPSAQTQSDIFANGCTYNAGQFKIDLSGKTCTNPRNGQSINVTAPSNGCPVIWLNFDLRAGAASFDYQLVSGSTNIGWALYYSTENQRGVDATGLSGDCSSLVLWQCGVSFTGWATMTSPPFAQTKNFYLAMWDMGCTNPSKYNAAGFNLNAFKARFGCGDNDCELSITASKEDVSCHGGNDGSASLTVINGVEPITYLWSNGDTTSSIDSLAAGTFLYTAVSDALGCHDSISNAIIINEPAALAATFSIENVKCFGSSDGSISTSVSGGTPPYTYRWSHGPTIASVAGLAPGTYSVSITDANNCILIDTASVSAPGEFKLGAVSVPPFCFNTSDGSIDLTATGGTPPFSFLWNNGATTEDISGLTAGNYTVTATDANGCVATVLIEVLSPMAVTVSGVVTDVACAGSSNGAVTLIVSGGTSPYHFSWSNSATTKDISGLSPGAYSVTVTDDNGCSVLGSFTVGQMQQLSLSLSTTAQISCFGKADGEICAQVSGGNGPYNFVWSNGKTTICASGLSAGNYAVTVSDVNGCSATASASLAQPQELKISSSIVKHISCAGASDGSIDLIITGGTPNFSFTWSNGMTTPMVNGLASGNYSVTVSDMNNCTATASFTITAPMPLTLGALPTPASCNGGSDGSIDLSVFGGTPPYKYSWSNGDTTEDVSGLDAVTYFVTVVDKNGCFATLSVQIAEPTPINFMAISSDVSCAGAADADIQLTVSGGSSPYTYEWSTGATSANVMDLLPGTYYFTITDDNGCQLMDSVLIESQSPVIVSAQISQEITCFGVNSGMICAQALGGILPYSFLWSNNQTSNCISNLAAGNYIVTVTDSNGCRSIASATLAAPIEIAISASVSDVTCFGSNDGSISLSVTGGVAPYNFIWSNGAFTQNIHNLQAGAYTVTVTDSLGCEKTFTAEVLEAAVISIMGTVSHVICASGDNGSIDVTVSGGNMPYIFSWSNGHSTEDISNLSAGVYQLEVTDANGCVTTFSEEILDTANAISVSATVEDIKCSGIFNGSIDITVSGGVAPYTFAWSNGSTNEDITGLFADDYTVTVADAKNCFIAQTFTVVQLPELIASAVVSKPISCAGMTDGEICANVSGGTAPYIFQWDNGQQTQCISGLGNGNYGFTVTDENGCTAVGAALSLQAPVPLNLTTITDNADCFGATDGGAALTVNGGTTPYNFIWSNGATTQNLTGVAAGAYSVTVTDARGCSATRSVNIGQPAPLVLGAVPTTVSCAGLSDGAIDLSVLGGIPPYDYKWSTGEIVQDIAGLSAGSYTVVVEDLNGCVSTLIVVVAEPQPLAITAVVNDASSAGNDGSIDLTVTGGTSPYHYQWSNGDTSQDLSNLPGGFYDVTVTDNSGCTATASFTVNGNFRLAETIQLSAYPNPSTGMYKMDIYSVEEGDAELYVTDLYNKQLQEEQLNLSGSKTTTTLDLTNYPSGSYLVLVKKDNIWKVTKLEKF